MKTFKVTVHEWAEMLRVTPREVRVQPMTRKWGSCSGRGRLCFATALLEESAAFQRYVIVHELLHLRVPNHGRLFIAYISAYVPDWKRQAGYHSEAVSRRAVATPRAQRSIRRRIL